MTSSRSVPPAAALPANNLRVDGHGRAGVTLTLLPKAGASRADAEHALGEILDRFWPAS